MFEHWLVAPSPLMGEGWDGGDTACDAVFNYLVHLYRGAVKRKMKITTEIQGIV